MRAGRHISAFATGLMALTLLLAAGVKSNEAQAEPLVADLSDHLVAIATDFTGTDVLLFGSIEDAGEVIVVVYGPRQNVTVRRKERTAGIWINREAVEFGGVPAFYHIAATPGALEDLPRSVLQRHQVGPENIKLDPPDGTEVAALNTFKEALIRNKDAASLYTVEPALVEMRGERLFRTTVQFPSNIPIGTYVIETLLVRDGAVKSAQTTPLFISKIGTGAQIFRTAHTFPILYGLAAIFFAGLAGWGASWAFRKLG